MKKITILLLTLLAVLTAIISGCCIKEPEAIPVKAVYYNEGTTDVYFYGGSEHTDDKIYIIGVDLDTKYSSEQFDDDIDWTDICEAENNEIIWCRTGGGWVPSANFLLRLQNPYDPTTDAGKRIFFNDKMFIITSYSGGEFGTTDTGNAYISTRSKAINFDYLY